MDHYDIVIIGAGNAGLSAAIDLAMHGKKTLIVEQHNLPGGCATSFRRGRFEFDPSLHELCGVGTVDNAGDVRELFDQYGVDIDWVNLKDCFRVISTYSDGSHMDATVPHGREKIAEAMEGLVPGSRPVMEKMFDLFHEVCEGLSFASQPSFNKVELVKKYPNLLRTGAYPTNVVLKKLKLPQKCLDIMATYWSYLGIDLDRLSFAHYAAMVDSYVNRGAAIPLHTSHELSVKLCERFRELGGEIRFNCRAEEVLFEGDRVCGVRTESGDIACDYVLANINPDILYGKMVPKSIIPDRLKKLFSARKQNYSARMLTAYFGLDCTPEELGLKDYAIFMLGTADTVREYKNMMRSLESNHCGIMVCPTVADPRTSPEGTTILSFTTFCGPEEWNSLTPERYAAKKTEAARHFMAMLLEKTGINLSGHIEEMEVATPWTFARYIGSPEGNVYGYEVDGWDSIVSRTMSIKKDYPIRGLRTIGAAGARGDGYGSAYHSGRSMAELALADLAAWGGKA